MIVRLRLSSYNEGMPCSELPNTPEDQSASRLLDALLRSRVSARSLTATEIRNLGRWCAKVARKRDQKIKNLLEQGQVGRARRYQVRLWRSPVARLHAAFQAQKIESKRLRSRGLLCRPFPFEHIWARSERLKNDFAKSIVIPRSKRKRGNARRTYYVFNVFGITKQKLFVNAIKPFVGFHPSQFMMIGGRPAACENLLRYANEPSLESQYFVKADVSQYYDTISHRYLEETLPAPKAIIRNTLLLHGWGGGVAMDQRGIPQGSAASSLIGEMVIADVLASAADVLPASLITYADDIGGLVPLRADAVALAECLTHAFEMHGAGPFRLRSEVAAAEGTFRFLGYEFSAPSDGQTLIANAPVGVADAMGIQLMNEFCDAVSANQLLQACRRLQGFMAAYRLAEDVREISAQVVELMGRELTRRTGTAGMSGTFRAA